MWREMRLGAKRFWTWFRGLPTWGQVVGWILAGIVALTIMGGIVGDDSTKTDTTAVTEPVETTTSQTETETTETKPTETKPAESKPPPEEDKPATAPPPKPKGDPEVDKHTRYYLSQMSACQFSVALVLANLRKGKLNDIELADTTTQARDVCETARSKLLLADTDHFDEEAALGFHGIDRFKSGLNAMLAYIDNPRPTKVIEARDKLQEGDQYATQARREINGRRHVYGLKRYRP
jgi:hypothetical protein